LTHCAIPALRKGHGHEGPGKDSIARGTLKGQTFRKRHQVQLEFNNGMRSRGLRAITFGKENTQQDLQQTIELEVTKQIIGTSIRLLKMSVRRLWRSWPSPKW
jgi:hypothetical protein